MAENEFKVGDLVELKSGGPEMTISMKRGTRAKDGAVLYDVTWFDNNNEPKKDTFPSDTLKPYTK